MNIAALRVIQSFSRRFHSTCPSIFQYSFFICILLPIISNILVCAILLTYSVITSGDKTCVTFCLAWHLAFHWHWIQCGLAWTSYAPAMNTAHCPCCVDPCCYVHNSLLHWPLPTLFVSSICFFYAILEMSSIKIKFSPAWHSIIGLHEVFLPLPWS